MSASAPARRRRVQSGAAVPRLAVTVQVADPLWRRLLPAPAASVRRAARAVLCARSGAPRALDLTGRRIEVCVALADDRLVRQLNRRYRGLDRPTNVLSFSGLPRFARFAPDIPLALGDIVLARETVAAEAAAQGKPVPDHLAHLVVHGVLHLLGYDHEEAGEARVMEELEIATLARLGIANPYQAKQAPARPRIRRPVER